MSCLHGREPVMVSATGFPSPGCALMPPGWPVRADLRADDIH